jgi:hypothetical protein
MRVLFVEQVTAFPAIPEGRVAVVDVAFAAGPGYESATLPFIEMLGDRLALWVDHHEHPIGWARYRNDPRFLLVPNREAHACPELVTPESVKRAGPLDVVVAHGDFDGLMSAVKFLRNGAAPWPECDEDARAADSPGRGHTMTARSAALCDALGQSQSTLHSKDREKLRQALVHALAESPDQLPPALAEQLEDLRIAFEKTLAPARDLAAQAKLESTGVLVVRVDKPLAKPLKKAVLSELEARAEVGVVIEGKQVTAATFRENLDLAEVAALGGGRSDYRFSTSDDQGRGIVDALGKLVRASRT